jgi:hypothetical protein
MHMCHVVAIGIIRDENLIIIIKRGMIVNCVDTMIPTLIYDSVL